MRWTTDRGHSVTRGLRGLTGLALAVVASAVLVAPSFAVTSRTISLSVPSSATTGATVTLHGYLTHSPVGSLILIRRKSGTSWIRVATARTTTSAGAFADSIPAPTTRGTYYYDAYAPGTSTLAGVVSKAYAVIVRTKVRVTLTSSTTAPSALSAVTLSGTVAPWRSGTPVFLEHMAAPATTWSEVASLSPNSAGHFSRSVNPTVNTTNRYRVVVSTRGYYTGAISPTVTVTPKTPVTTPVSWHTPVSVDPPQSALVSISCPTSLFCAAVDLDGNVVTYQSGAWSQALNVLRSPAQLATVSCSSATFCVAMWSDQQSVSSYSVFNGAAWSAAARVGGTGSSSPGSLSCASSTFCMFVGSTNYWYTIFDGSTWASAMELPDSPLISGGEADVSCTSATRCVLTQAGQYLYTWDGTKWSEPQTFETAPLTPGSSVSCPTALTCFVADGSSVLTLTGSTLSAPQAVDPGNSGIVTLSCASTTSCAALDEAGNVFVMTDSGWSAPEPIFSNQLGEALGLSCASSAMCIAADGSSGNVRTFDGTQWSNPVEVILPEGYLTAVSCVSNTVCVGGDDAGNVVAFGPSGPYTQVVPITGSPASPINELSCRTATDCEAGTGNLVIDFGSGVPRIGFVAPTTIVGLSCTPGRCTAVDHGGHVWVRTTSIWSQQTTLPTQINGISCATDTFCMAYDDAQHIYRSNGTTWTTAPQIAPTASTSHDIYQLRCTAPTLCSAEWSYPAMSIFNGTNWHQFHSGSTLYPAKDYCFAAQQCYAIETYGESSDFNGVGWRYDGYAAPGYEYNWEYGPVASDFACYDSSPATAAPSVCVTVGAGGYAQFGNP